MKLELPSRELLESALYASANATTKIVFLVLIGVVATANGTYSHSNIKTYIRVCIDTLHTHTHMSHHSFPHLFAGVFNDQGVSDLGRLVYHVTLPALLFVNIISEVCK